MPTLTDVQAYAPELGLAEVATRHLDAAEAWAGRVVGEAAIAATARTDAECAYVLYSLSRQPLSTSGEQGIAGFDMGGFTVKLAAPVSVEAALRGTDWLALAYRTLYEAGVPRPGFPAGAA